MAASLAGGTNLGLSDRRRFPPAPEDALVGRQAALTAARTLHCFKHQAGDDRALVLTFKGFVETCLTSSGTLKLTLGMPHLNRRGGFDV